MNAESNIIPFEKYYRKYDGYASLLQEVIEDLQKYSSVVSGHAVNLAMRKAYKEWDDQQPVGAELEITEEMLLECGDSRVVALVRLGNCIDEVLTELGGEKEKEE